MPYNDYRIILNEKLDCLYNKAKIVKKPKLELKKQFAPAEYHHRNNTIYISETTIDLWKKGIITEKEIDYSLAHEFGHVIANTKDKNPIGSKITLYNLALVIPLIIAAAAHFAFEGIGVSSIVTGIMIVCISITWLCFLPWILRRIFVPWELIANRYAITYSLISEDVMAKALLRFMSQEKIGPIKMLNILYNIITHPFLSENLENIGYRFREGSLEKIQNKN